MKKRSKYSSGGGGNKGQKRNAAGPVPDVPYVESIIERLPNEVALDILTRLPADSLINCKLVSKCWCKTIRCPSFAKLHLDRASLRQQLDGGEVSFLFLTLGSTSKLYKGCYAENRNPCVEFKISGHPLIQKKIRAPAFVGSCNGLVCLTEHHTNQIYDPVYICNPNLGEKISLPKFKVISKNTKKNVAYLDREFMVSGFGYTSETEEYKVVRIYYAASKPKAQVQVYTLGSENGWRNIGEISYSLQRYDFRLVLDSIITDTTEEDVRGISHPCRGILANGSLHWLDREWNIVAFELAKEEFSLILSPPGFCGDNICTLQEVAGRLCLANSNKGKRLDIWSFKNESNEWELMFKISCHRSDQFVNVFWPVSLTLSGNLLLRSDYKNITSYDPRTKKFEKQMDLNTGTKYPKIEAIPYVSTFVSLKALGVKV